VNTLKAVKPDKAKMVEDILISNARMGRLQGRVSIRNHETCETIFFPDIVFDQLTENDLKDILARVNSQTHREMKVNISRRAFDSDDDES
jgi:DNA-binding TFAR19-related protein (PDSD5 family)